MILMPYYTGSDFPTGTTDDAIKARNHSLKILHIMSNVYNEDLMAECQAMVQFAFDTYPLTVDVMQYPSTQHEPVSRIREELIRVSMGLRGATAAGYAEQMEQYNFFLEAATGTATGGGDGTVTNLSAGDKYGEIGANVTLRGETSGSITSTEWYKDGEATGVSSLLNVVTEDGEYVLHGITGAGDEVLSDASTVRFISADLTTDTDTISTDADVDTVINIFPSITGDVEPTVLNYVYSVDGDITGLDTDQSGPSFVFIVTDDFVNNPGGTVTVSGTVEGIDMTPVSFEITVPAPAEEAPAEEAPAKRTTRTRKATQTAAKE